MYFASVKIICLNLKLTSVCKDISERNVDGLHKQKPNILDIMCKKIR
jgi:hypothetical protein